MCVCVSFRRENKAVAGVFLHTFFPTTLCPRLHLNDYQSNISFLSTGFRVGCQHSRDGSPVQGRCG